jgi:hypothetical protein
MERELERLIDLHGLRDLLDVLSDIASARAERLAMAHDCALAKAWMKAAHAIAKATIAIGEGL